MGYVFKFAYDGTKFSGYQKGNGQNSIEDTIVNKLDSAGINSRIMSAARTDRGVSALGNAVYIDSDEKPNKIAGVINAGCKDMIFHSYSPVEDGFKPRHCDMKVYRYILQAANLEIEKFSETLQHFVGTHDFSSFSRTDGRNPVRTIDRIEVTKSDQMAYVDFYGQSFLWNQIRNIIAYALRNHESNADADPFDMKTRFSGLAEPYPLVLMDILYSKLTFSRIPLLSYRKRIRADIAFDSVKLERDKFLLDFVSGKEFSYAFNFTRDERP
ncbi:MAG: tRNA pseudouridine(38-40) synthase TruA [Thermoplasmatales archaeon B_DKE]|nr:MAG: tRNA pseudouridine(38-40) synthase TruA [Thermoplasmatales archaeon B_DKE]